MDFETLLQLQDASKVSIYIPTYPNQFFEMELVKVGHAGICINNLDKYRAIDGHRMYWHFSKQQDVDNFFYIIKGDPAPDDFVKAKEHYQKNGKSRIYENPKTA